MRNRINVANTDLPYADLAGPDPVPFRAHVFHVVGHLHNMYQVAYEAQALLGLGRPWLHRYAMILLVGSALCLSEAMLVGVL